MATKKERKWFQSEECKSIPLISTRKTNQKSWRSSWLSPDDSKPAIKPPRKILRLGQNDTNLNPRSTSETKQKTDDNNIWKVRKTSKQNSCDLSLCNNFEREVQEQKVLPHRKQGHKKSITKNELKSSTTYIEESKNINEMRNNLQENVRKAISKFPDKSKFDDIKNTFYAQSLERGSGSSNDSRNQKKQYSPLVSRSFLNNNEVKSNQSDNIPRFLMPNQTMVKNSNLKNKLNFEKSDNVSMYQSLRKNHNENFSVSKKIANYFFSNSNLVKETEPKSETCDCEETPECKESKFHLNVSSDSRNIGSPLEISKSNQNGVFENSSPTKNQNFYANFEALTVEDLKDFVENLRRFLHTKIISHQYMNSELFDDSNVHCFDCHCIECSKDEHNESNKILEDLCSHVKKSTDEKNSLINPINFNEINVIATVRVVNSACEVNDKDQSLEQFSEEKCEVSDQPNEDIVLSSKETTLLKLNVEKCKFIQTNPIKYKDNRELTMPFVYDEKLMKPYNPHEEKNTNSLVICRGIFSEFVLWEIIPPLLYQNILQKVKGACSKISTHHSLVILKQFNMQQDQCKTMSNFLTTQFISKYYANSTLSARNWLSFQIKQVLPQQFKNNNEILTKDLKKNHKYRKINQPTKKETKFKGDPVNMQKNVLNCNKLKNINQQPVGKCPQNKDIASFQETNLNILPEFISKHQPLKKEIEAIRKEKYIKNYIFDTTDNSKVRDYLYETCIYEKTLIKERKTNKQFPLKNMSEPKTTVSKHLTLDYDPEMCDYFPDSILLTEETSPGTIFTTEETSISLIPKNGSISRKSFHFDSPNFKNSLSLKEKQLISAFSEECDLLSTCSTPQTPVKMQGSDDEQNCLVKTESLHHVINNSFCSKMETDISEDQDTFLPEISSSESLSADEATDDCISDYANIDSLVSSRRCSQADSDDNFQTASVEEEKGRNVFSLQQTPDFVDHSTTKIKDLDHSFEITYSSLADDQNEDNHNDDDDDDDSDSVLSLYAPSSASFLDENEINNSDIRFVENLLSEEEEEEERKTVKSEQMPATTSVISEDKLTSSIKGESLDIEGKDNKQLSSSDIKQALKTQEFEESSNATIKIEDVPVPVGYCSQFVKKGNCSMSSACPFQHKNPSKEEFLISTFSEDCKNGKLNKAFDLLISLKDLNNDVPEYVSLLLRSCLSQSNRDMTFLLIPELIQHKMLTPKIVNDIFSMCAPCPFKYEEKLWKLYETMKLLNLCLSLNSARILLHMYFEMGNWHKIWQILLNTIIMEPLSAIPTAIYHGALNFVINDSSNQHLPIAAEWICMLAVDDLWNIEPCLLYHLSILFKTKEYFNAFWILLDHLQQINCVPQEIIFTEEVDEPQRNPEYISCLQNIREIQSNKNWHQLSDIFIFIYENPQLSTCWFIQPIVEGFLKVDNFSMMTVFTDFINITCCQLKKLVMENSSYPVSGCRKHLVRMIGNLISFCYNNQMWSDGIQIVSVFLKNKLEFDLKDHLDSIPHNFILLALDICLHSQEPLKAISLLEGLGWFCQLPPMQFLKNFHLNQWLKKILKILIDQLASLDKFPNGCRVFSLFVFILQEETDRWHTNEKLSPFNPKKFLCINHAELMIVSNKFIHQCLTSENVKSAIYTYNTIKSFLPKINPCCYNVAIYRALLVAAHLGPRFLPCAKDLYNLCARHLEVYPSQKLIQPPWTLEIVLHMTDIEMHLIMEDFLESLYDILSKKFTTVQQLTLAVLHLCVMVRDDIVIDVFPNMCYLRNVPVNRMEVLQQAMFVLQTYVAPPLEVKINNHKTGLLVNPESLKHFMFVKDSQRRNQGLQFRPVSNKKAKQKFRGKGRFR